MDRDTLILLVSVGVLLYTGAGTALGRVVRGKPGVKASEAEAHRRLRAPKMDVNGEHNFDAIAEISRRDNAHYLGQMVKTVAART